MSIPKIWENHECSKPKMNNVEKKHETKHCFTSEYSVKAKLEKLKNVPSKPDYSLIYLYVYIYIYIYIQNGKWDIAI